MKSGSPPLRYSVGVWIFGSASVVGNGARGGPPPPPGPRPPPPAAPPPPPPGAPAAPAGAGGETPELNTPIVSTRGSLDRPTVRNPPHDTPITATLSLSILAPSAELLRAASACDQSSAARRSSTVACGGVAFSG